MQTQANRPFGAINGHVLVMGGGLCPPRAQAKGRFPGWPGRTAYCCCSIIHSGMIIRAPISALSVWVEVTMFFRVIRDRNVRRVRRVI